jgi:hypothetical protein
MRKWSFLKRFWPFRETSRSLLPHDRDAGAKDMSYISRPRIEMDLLRLLGGQHKASLLTE